MTCTYDQADTAPGIHLCKRCEMRLEDVLRQIPEALEVAQDTIAKQDKAGGTGPSGSTPAQSSEPLNMDTMDKRRELWESVVSNAREVLEHDDSDDLRNVEPAVYLQMSVDIIRRQDFAGNMLDELERAVRKLWSAVDRRPDVIALGQCGVVHESLPCPGVLRARVIHQDPDGSKRVTEQFVRCRACGATHDAIAIQQASISEAWDHYGPLADVVKALRQSGYMINLKSAQRWASEGELVGTYQDGVAVYSPAQVRKTHQLMKTRKGGRPRKVA